MAAFEKSGAQVNVEHVKHAEPLQIDVGAQATATLASYNAEIICVSPNEWKAAKDDIAIGSPLVPAGFANAISQSQLLGNEPRLVVLAGSIVDTDDFL
jgi:hypothetical protein